ncbi:sensor histidine kinase [Ottowia sp.]|uniref:sensor histidine kinase n=1 Tax=Ottowia sp. TaxID=1898956 RepID=UPI003A8A0B90
MTSAPNAVAHRLHWRIWLAVAGSVAVLSVLVGLGWKLAEDQRERERTPSAPREEPARDVLVRDATGAVIGIAEAQRRGRGPGPERVLEFDVTLADGQMLTLEMLPRPRGPGGPSAQSETGPKADRPPGSGGPHHRGDRQRGAPPLGWLLRPPYGFLWVLVLAGLVVMVGVYPVARRLTTRLEALQRGVQRWGDGDLSARMPEGGNDEVADLSRRFNAAAQRIEQLMDSQAALLQSQKSLLANASHELRSPLARIRMALELMVPPHPPAAEAAPLHSVSTAQAEIARNITELDQLVEEILLASRLDAQEADLGTVEAVDLMGLLAEECARVDAQMEVTQGTAQVMVPGVAKLLRRAVRNLLENAVRHGSRTGRGHEVRAELTVQNRQAVLHVDDRGPGVPPEQQNRIFEPFYRLPGASEREGGVGLGLALVRSIAERHHGSVGCSNIDSGGARFTLKLPLA